MHGACRAKKNRRQHYSYSLNLPEVIKTYQYVSYNFFIQINEQSQLQSTPIIKVNISRQMFSGPDSPLLDYPGCDQQ